MQDLKVNFLGPDKDPSAKKKLFFVLKTVGALVLAFAILVGIAASSGSSEDGFLAGLREIPVVKRMRQLIRSADRSLEGEEKDRINILLLGMGGAGHEGPYLTDTIILGSVKPSTGEVAFISIPRDMAAPIPGRGWYKVNSANAYGEAATPGEGGELVRKVLSDVFALPIHYYVRVDFDGFTELIDELGGIDVYVERGFADTQYPTGVNGEVRTLSFDAGWQHMGGKTALEFARSRHGSNNEAGDFARARRQQKILEAVKDRVFSLGTLRSPAKISAVYESLRDHIRTNFSPWELLALSRLGAALRTDDIITYVLDDGPGGFLEPTLGIDGAYLLIPKQNSWQPVRTFVETIFDQASLVTEKPKPPLVRIEIQNGTFLPGLAARKAAELDAGGFTIVRIGNAERRGEEPTVIYDLSGGIHPEAAQKLSELLGAPVERSVPDWVFADLDPVKPRITESATAAEEPDVDFLIILGTDQ